jgi:hypothetical protein
MRGNKTQEIWPSRPVTSPRTARSKQTKPWPGSESETNPDQDADAATLELMPPFFLAHSPRRPSGGSL